MGNARHASGCAVGFGGVDSSKWVMGEGAGEKKRKKEREKAIALGPGLGQQMGKKWVKLGWNWA